MTRLACALRLWRLTGYDGRPTTWTDAWAIAGALHPALEPKP